MQALPLWASASCGATRPSRRAQAVRSQRSHLERIGGASPKDVLRRVLRAIGNERLTTEVLELLTRLEQESRRLADAGGWCLNRTAIRAQLEQTALRLELVGLRTRKRQSKARLNGLLARDANRAARRSAGIATVANRDDPSMLPRSPTGARSTQPQLQAELARLAGAQKIREPHPAQSLTPTWSSGWWPTQSGLAHHPMGPDVRDQHPAAAGFSRAPGARGRSDGRGRRARSEALVATSCLPSWPGTFRASTQQCARSR
jgi:hypothetical protein